MQVQTFHDTATATFTYVIVDEVTRKCAIIDSVLNYDQFSGAVRYDGADEVVAFIKQQNLENESLIGPGHENRIVN